jgi:hypothetical protein
MDKQKVIQRLDELEAYADQHTIRLADAVALIDAMLLACSRYVDRATMERITAEGDTALRRAFGRTCQWSWRERATEDTRPAVVDDTTSE